MCVARCHGGAGIGDDGGDKACSAEVEVAAPQSAAVASSDAALP